MHVSIIHERFSETKDEWRPCALENADRTVVACTEQHSSGEGEVGLAMLLFPATDDIEGHWLRTAQSSIDEAQMKSWEDLETARKEAEGV